MPLNMNTIGTGSGIGGTSGESTSASQLINNNVTVTETYYDNEDIYQIESGTVAEETNRSIRIRELADTKITSSGGGYNDTGWFIRATMLYVEETSDNNYIASFSVNPYYDNQKPIIRIVRFNTANATCTLIKEFTITDYGGYLFNGGGICNVVHNGLLYTLMVATSTWDIWLVSIDLTTGVSTELIKVTSTIGTGNNYAFKGMTTTNDVENTCIWMVYNTGGRNDDGLNKLIKYDIKTNTLTGPFSAPSYTPTFQCKYSTVESHSRNYTDKLAYNRDWTLPNISPTFVFGENSRIIDDKIVIGGRHTVRVIENSASYYPSSYAFSLFKFKETESGVTMTVITDNITSIYNTYQYGGSPNATYQYSQPFCGTIGDNNFIFGFHGVKRGGVFENGRRITLISLFEFMYLPDTGEYGIRTVYDVGTKAYMSYCYNDASIDYTPITLFKYGEYSNVYSYYDNNAPFQMACLSANSHIRIFTDSLSGPSIYFFAFGIIAPLVKVSSSSDSRYGEFKYAAKKGDILYGSDPITDVTYKNTSKVVKPNSRKYIIDTDDNVTIRITHDTFRYRPFILVRDQSGTFINLQLEHTESTVNGKFMKNMKINEIEVTKNGVQTLTNDSFKNDRLYVNMEDI